jgi:hypothetical protein
MRTYNLFLTMNATNFKTKQTEKILIRIQKTGFQIKICSCSSDNSQRYNIGTDILRQVDNLSMKI